MNREELGKGIYNVAHITGEFLLRSGQTSNEYFDKYLFESNPELLKNIASQLLEKINVDYDLLAGLEMGGIPIATALSFECKKQTIFVRKKAKKYGTCKLAEGIQFSGKKLLVVEDVVTTGGQIIESVNELRKLGAEISHVVCVIVRDPRAFENLKSANLDLIPLFTMEELKELVK